MTINQIRYFLTVAEYMSFTEAARRLYMTQPALGRQITALERELNLLLFMRSTRGLTLTAAGNYLKTEWSKQLDIYESTIRHAQHISQGFTGSLSVGILEGMDIPETLSRSILQMEQRYADILLNLKRYSFRDLREKLLKKELDLIVTYYMDIAGLEHLDLLHITKFQPALAVPVTNPLSKKETIEPADLKDQEFIITGQEDATFGVKTVVDYFRRYGNFYPKLYFVDTVDETLLRLETGNRCALLNTELSIARSGKVKLYPFEDDLEEEHWFSAAWNKTSRNVSLQRFLEILSENVKLK